MSTRGRFGLGARGVGALLTAVALTLGVAARAEPPPEARLGPSTGVDLTEPSEALSALVGRRVGRVEIEVGSALFPDKPTLAGGYVGQALELDTGRRILREILSTGLYASGSVRAEPSRDGVVLHVTVLPRRIAKKIDIAGDVFERRETLEALGLDEGGEVTAQSLAAVPGTLREAYARRGYPSAEARIDVATTDEADGVVVRITIVPGPEKKIGRRVVQVSAAESARLGTLRDDYQLGPGARADEVALDKADRSLVDALKRARFLSAKVTHQVSTEVVSGREEHVLTVVIDAGPKLTVEMEGNRSFEREQIEQVVTQLTGREEALRTDLAARVSAFYQARGFFDVSVEAERPTPADGIELVRLQIREGGQLRVAHRVFPCLSGEFSPDDIGREIDGVLDEQLPGQPSLWGGAPGALAAVFGGGGGGRASLVDLRPAMTYTADAYDKALQHVRELLVSRGYLNAVVGPVSMLRATCSPSSRGGECVPLAPTELVVASCQRDALGLPVQEPPVPESLTCKPNPLKGVRCASEATLRIPLHLGPRTTLYDLAFDGNRAFSAARLGEISALQPGKPLSALEVDAARKRILDAYRDDGYAFAEVRSAIEPSPDRTRARVRISIAEREQVIVREIRVQGATRTRESIVRGRVALEVGKPFRLDKVRQTEERLATLGSFASISVALDEPEIPQRDKAVVITVTEQAPQYLNPTVGFSSGDGLRFAIEYGHRNIAGLAIALTLRVQLSYLFDVLVIDPTVRANFDNLSVLEQLERRNALSLLFPEIGLGPEFSLSLDGIDVRDNQRDFGITKDAFIPMLTYRPTREITAQVSASVEVNDVRIFNQEALAATQNLLRVPQGSTVAFSQRLKGTYDGRDSALSAQRGFFATASVEHVNALPAAIYGTQGTDITSHFLRISGRVAGYIPLGSTKASVAMSLAGGYNLQLEPESTTYPDRLFFQGGVDSVRSFLLDAVVPEDIARQLLAANANDPKALTISDIAIRGGDLSLNPRLELRFPVWSIFQAGVFLDAGSLWFDPTKLDLGAWRTALGAGVRIPTPAGPLAFDYGFNLQQRPWEDVGAFHFSVGLF